MNSAAKDSPAPPNAAAAPPSALGSECLKQSTTDGKNAEGLFSGVRSRIHCFLNSSMDDHKACISSSYNKAVERIKSIKGRKADQESPAGVSTATASSAVE